MSHLQLALIALGAVFIAGVIAYNAWQERRVRRQAEKAFGERPPDTLFERRPDKPLPSDARIGRDERREPTLGPVPPGDLAEAGDALEGRGGPQAEISSRIDTVAVILADDPVMREQLEPLLDALQSHTTPVHVEGIVDEQWHPIETSPRASWRELRVGLQLASRSGPVGEDEIERFNGAIADFAASANAVSQREAPAAAAARARELDAFCAEADIEVAVNVVGQFGATFAVPRVKSLALEHGLAETSSGDFVDFGEGGSVEFVARRFDDPGAKRSPSYYTAISFALDLPNCPDPPGALARMVELAQTFAREFGGQLVDDNRRPLTEAGIASIRRTLEGIMRDMEAHGIPAGGALARRLFA